MQRESPRGATKSQRQSSQTLGELVLTASCPSLLLLRIMKEQEELVRNLLELVESPEREGWETFVPRAQGAGVCGTHNPEKGNLWARPSLWGPHSETHRPSVSTSEKRGQPPSAPAQCRGKEVGTEVAGWDLGGRTPTWMGSLTKPH